MPLPEEYRSTSWQKASGLVKNQVMSPPARNRPSESGGRSGSAPLPVASDILWAAKLAHELNNALMAAQSNLDSLRLVWGELATATGLARPEQVRQHPAARWASEVPGLLEDMGSSLAFISGVVSRMRALAQPPAESPARFDVQAAIQGALRQVRDALGPDIRVARSPASGACPAHGDASAFQQVLVNLFLNAARAMEDTDGPRVLAIRVSRGAGRRVRVVVSDTGPGVRPADRDRLFQPFFTTCRERGGTGLGLFISREIMRRQGGALALESRTRPGATFVVTLPS